MKNMKIGIKMKSTEKNTAPRAPQTANAAGGIVKPRLKKVYYVGLTPGKRVVFYSDVIPVQRVGFYNAVIGPFRTKQGAEFMSKHGGANPHCQTVADAERLAKKYKTRKVKCDQCDILVINNVVCHETGCPNKKRG
jgi:hypothetical protein